MEEKKKKNIRKKDFTKILNKGVKRERNEKKKIFYSIQKIIFLQ